MENARDTAIATHTCRSRDPSGMQPSALGANLCGNPCTTKTSPRSSRAMKENTLDSDARRSRVSLSSAPKREGKTGAGGSGCTEAADRRAPGKGGTAAPPLDRGEIMSPRARQGPLLATRGRNRHPCQSNIT